MNPLDYFQRIRSSPSLQDKLLYLQSLKTTAREIPESIRDQLGAWLLEEKEPLIVRLALLEVMERMPLATAKLPLLQVLLSPNTTIRSRAIHILTHKGVEKEAQTMLYKNYLQETH